MNKTLPKNWSYIFCILFGIYVAAVLWITLFSRIGAGYRSFQFPFQSYIEVIKGSWRPLVENIENVLLFIPWGFAVGTVKKLEWKKVVIIGFSASLCIELLQAIFALGTFECDDLIHNTLGVVAGYWIAEKVGIVIAIQSRRVKIASVTLIVAVMLPFSYQAIHHQHMINLAAQYDRADGAKNLLILNGKNGYAWDTDVYVSYQEDGSIHIQGTSDKTSWWPIADLELNPGTYTFSGLSDVDKETVALELETDNHRFAPDVGSNVEVTFTLDKTTKLKAYVLVYDGCNCDVTAIPVIYKEE